MHPTSKLVSLALSLALGASVFEHATAFASPTSSLTEAYQRVRDRALAHSSTLELARDEARQKSSARWTAWTQWLPRADLSLTQSQSLDYSFVTSGALSGTPFSFEPEQVNRSRWSLSATFPIYQRSVHLGIQQASQDSLRSHARLAIAEGEFESRLKNAFGQVLAEEHALLSVAGSLEASRKSLTEAQLRFNLGQKTKLDVLRAEADLSLLESKKLTAIEKRSAAVNALAELAAMDRSEVASMGLISDSVPSDEALKARELALREGIESLTAVDDLLQKLSPYLAPENDNAAISAIEKRLSGHHPRIELIHAEEDLSRIRAASAWAAEWPQLSLQASLNKQAETWDEAISPGERSYAIQLGLTIPLFSFGSSISRFRERNAIRDGGETQARASALELRNSIINDRTRILTLIQAEKAQKIAIRQNEELTELSFKSYQLGRATILELLSAQSAAMEARTQWVRTRVQLASLVGNFAWNLLDATETE